MDSPLRYRTDDLLPIQEAELFASFSEEEKKAILSWSALLHLRRRARLFSIGGRAEHFYLLLEGAIRIFRDDGDEMARFVPGDTIGDFDFAGQDRYDAHAEAAEDSLLIMFPGYGLTLEDCAREDPHTVSRIYFNRILIMTSRIKAAQELIAENTDRLKELHRQAYEDPGTGLWRQSLIQDELSRTLEAPTALIMLKPDRFKLLVDTRGHLVGDEAMIRIAKVLKDLSRRLGKGWPLRFKSNETGLLIPHCDAPQAEALARQVAEAVAALEPAPPQGDLPAFEFSGAVSWGIWPEDQDQWDMLFQGVYDLLLETWRAGSRGLSHFSSPGETGGRQG
jgi:diguanylate cyclase (GGDEF)-like protein